MKGYRKISEGYVTVDKEEIDGADLNDNLIASVNHAVTDVVLTHAEMKGILEYKVVIYAQSLRTQEHSK